MGIFVGMALAVLLAPEAGPRIHSVSDISHEFTFYMDGRFWTQYVGEAGGADARNWGTLSKLDLDNVNLLVLSSGPGPVPYAPESIAHVRRFVEAGGAAVIMAMEPLAFARSATSSGRAGGGPIGFPAMRQAWKASS